MTSIALAQNIEIHKTLNAVEKGFNVAGSLPIVGIISGAIRSSLGKIQLVAGAALAATATVLGFISKHTYTSTPETQSTYKRILETGFAQVNHGALNIARGYVEAAASASLIGSIILCGIQATHQNGFNPIFRYEAV